MKSVLQIHFDEPAKRFAIHDIHMMSLVGVFSFYGKAFSWFISMNQQNAFSPNNTLHTISLSIVRRSLSLLVYATNVRTFAFYTHHTCTNVHMKSVLLIHFDEPAKRFAKKKFTKLVYCIYSRCQFSLFVIALLDLQQNYFICIYEKRLAGSPEWISKTLFTSNFQYIVYIWCR